MDPSAQKPASPVKPEKAVLQEFAEICERLDLSNEAAAHSSGLSVHTIRLIRLGQMPRTKRCQEQMATFCRRYRNAQSRGELRLFVA